MLTALQQRQYRVALEHIRGQERQLHNEEYMLDPPANKPDWVHMDSGKITNATREMFVDFGHKMDDLMKKDSCQFVMYIPHS